MTQEQKRIAIAEACGWNEMRDGRWKLGDQVERFLPDYLNDLNAVHELEKILEGGLRSTYDAWLGITAKQDHCFIWETTAAQRCEAIGKTLNLW